MTVPWHNVLDAVSRKAELRRFASLGRPDPGPVRIADGASTRLGQGGHVPGHDMLHGDRSVTTISLEGRKLTTNTQVRRRDLRVGQVGVSTLLVGVRA